MSSQLSGRSEALHDANGNIFVDYSPDVFMPLVNWLRDIRDVEPNVFVEVAVKDDCCKYSWIRMMRAYKVDVRNLVAAGIGFHTQFPWDILALSYAPSLDSTAHYNTLWAFLSQNYNKQASQRKTFEGQRQSFASISIL